MGARLLIRTASDIGALIRDRRKHQKLGQADLRLHGLECPSTGGPGVELVG